MGYGFLLWKAQRLHSVGLGSHSAINVIRSASMMRCLSTVRRAPAKGNAKAISAAALSQAHATAPAASPTPTACSLLSKFSSAHHSSSPCAERLRTTYKLPHDHPRHHDQFNTATARSQTLHPVQAMGTKTTVPWELSKLSSPQTLPTAASEIKTRRFMQEMLVLPTSPPSRPRSSHLLISLSGPRSSHLTLRVLVFPTSSLSHSSHPPLCPRSLPATACCQ
jgi:hypothetical protein